MFRKILFVLIAMILTVGLVGCENDPAPDTPTASPEATPVNFDTIDSSEGVNELYQLVDIPSSQMMSYILKTKTGKLIVLDGGYARNGAEIVALAQQLTGQEVPEIEAWFFSHSHSDHVDAFTELMLNNPGALNVKQIYHHFTSEEYVIVNELSNIKTYRMFMRAVEAYDPDGTKTAVVKQGDVYTFDDVSVEVMLVPDETADIKAIFINEASVVYRMTIDGQRVLFLGDAYHVAGQRLQEAYPDDLTADIVQMAHHGSQGVEKELYALIQPKACLWPTPQIMWDEENQVGGSANWGLETVELHRYMRYDLGVKKHYIARDGLQQLVFPLDLD